MAGWTDHQRGAFLARLAETGNVSDAARWAAVSRSSAYALRLAEEEFALQWAEAQAQAVDALEMEARRRAVDGIEQPVLYAGKPVHGPGGNPAFFLKESIMDLWGEAKQALGAVAPILGTAVGGPLGGTAARLVASALGLDPATPAQQLAAAVTAATPDQLAALQKADQDFQVSLKNLDLSAEKIAADDRSSARTLEASTHDWVPGTLMMLLTGGFFGLIGYLASHDVPVGNRDLLNIMLGTLGAAWTGGVTYYYGSSVGAAVKDKAIGTLMQR